MTFVCTANQSAPHKRFRSVPPPPGQDALLALDQKDSSLHLPGVSPSPGGSPSGMTDPWIRELTDTCAGYSRSTSPASRTPLATSTYSFIFAT